LEEVLIPFPQPLLPLTRVRSTLLIASLNGLKQAGHADRYFGILAADRHAAMRALPAGIWVPAGVAEAHYGACDALGLTQLEIHAMGNTVATVTAQVFLQLVLRTAKEAGTTPWAVLGNSPRYWARYYDGSAVRLTKLGPKEAHLEVGGSSLAAFPYWRTAFGAILVALAAPFCTKAYVRELKQPSRSGALYRLAWA
jgi:hypothetical protein